MAVRIRIALVGLLAAACTTTPVTVFEGDASGPPPPDGRAPTVAAPPSVALDQTCANAMTGPYEESLPVPTVQAEEDDNTVHLQFFGGEGTRDLAQVVPANFEGVRVCWGASAAQLTHASLFRGRRGQLFGVVNGQPYVAVVQSVDAFGRVSRPSAPVGFTGNPARVDRLRREMTGFFDDFNLSEGGLDERRWNVAYSNHDPTATGTFIGAYQHAVSMLGTTTQLPGSEPTDGRAQNVARPRAVFDFTGREGRIVFDLDGAEGGRHTWYLDVFPYASRGDTIDVTAHPTFDPGPGYPGRFLRFAQSGGTLIINQHDASGQPIHAVRGEIQAHRDLGPGEYMRHFELRVSRNRAAIYMDGELQLENREVALDFERGVLNWAQFGYNLLKMERAWATFMWDNFGFDGPPPTTRTLNYVAGFNGSDRLRLGWVVNPPGYGQTGSLTIPIPDALTGATGARLFYTIDGGSGWDAADHFVVNGQRIAIPRPGTEFQPFASNLALPAGLLRTGDNDVQVTVTSGIVRNVHIEADFDAAQAPAYTQPAEALGRSPLQRLPPVGPDGYVDSINGVRNGPGPYAREDVVSVETNGDNDGASPRVTWRAALRGTIRVNAAVFSRRAASAYRQNLGVARVELLVDGVSRATVNTGASVPAPEIADGPNDPSQPFESPVFLMFDTTQVPNGVHQLEVRAYDSAGNYGRILTPYVTPLVYVNIAN
jgi:hypothetical protein